MAILVATGALLGLGVAVVAGMVALDVWVLSVALVVPLVAAAILVRRIQRRLFISSAIQRLATGLIAHPEPVDLRVALAEAFDDPALEVVYLERPRRGMDRSARAARPRAGGGLGSVADRDPRR